MDYRHGPIAIAQPGRGVWIFGEPPAGLLDDVIATGATIVHHPDLDPMASLVIAQRVAVAKSLALGPNPDQPRSSPAPSSSTDRGGHRRLERPAQRGVEPPAFSVATSTPVVAPAYWAVADRAAMTLRPSPRRRCCGDVSIWSNTAASPVSAAFPRAAIEPSAAVTATSTMLPRCALVASSYDGATASGVTAVQSSSGTPPAAPAKAFSVTRPQILSQVSGCPSPSTRSESHDGSTVTLVTRETYVDAIATTDPHRSSSTAGDGPTVDPGVKHVRKTFVERAASLPRAAAASRVRPTMSRALWVPRVGTRRPGDGLGEGGGADAEAGGCGADSALEGLGAVP